MPRARDMHCVQLTGIHTADTEPRIPPSLGPSLSCCVMQALFGHNSNAKKKPGDQAKTEKPDDKDPEQMRKRRLEELAFQIKLTEKSTASLREQLRNGPRQVVPINGAATRPKSGTGR